RGPGRGEPLELEATARPAALLQPIEQRLEADDSLFGDEVEGRYALEFDLGDDSEHAEADTCQVEGLGILLGRQPAGPPIGAQQSQAGDGAGEPGEAKARAVSARRDRPGD